MLMYGNKENIPEQCVVYNFSSLMEGYPDAKLLPPNNLGAMNEYDFDMRYMHYLLDIDLNFVNFMNIIINLYYGYDVYLIISDDEWSKTLIDSLMKLVQQRYMINGVYINSYEDYIYEKVYNGTTSDFEDFGLVNLMTDKDRYVYLYELDRAQKGKDIPAYD